MNKSQEFSVVPNHQAGKVSLEPIQHMRAAAKRIAAELGVSAVTVSVNLPYQSVVYKLEKRSKYAVRCERWRKNGKGWCFDMGDEGESDKK